MKRFFKNMKAVVATVLTAAIVSSSVVSCQYDDTEIWEKIDEIEQEIAELDDDEKQMFLEDLGLKESGLEKLIKASYSLLGLISFLTSGSDECRAWTFKKGMKAPACAGIIHSDFEKGFIRCETMSFDDLEKYGSELKVKEAGRTRLEGKEYIIKQINTEDEELNAFLFSLWPNAGPRSPHALSSTPRALF